MDVIAIDGPAGSGKSTISRRLSRKLGCQYLDTGAIYRTIALAARRRGIDSLDSEKLAGLCRDLNLVFRTDTFPPRPFLGDEDISEAIRTPEIDMLASSISALKEVREAMLGVQRSMAQRGRVVVEGRDMGTVVFPEAEHKFFLTADPGVRAERRYRERRLRGEPVSRAFVEKDLTQRDKQDQNRSLAPLKPAQDAVIIDSSSLSEEEVLERILAVISENNGHFQSPGTPSSS